MSIIKGKSFICTECMKNKGDGCNIYIVGVPMIPILCPCDVTLTPKFTDQTERAKRMLRI